MLIQPLVLCGGSGSRLWPLSREKYPKQLLQLVGSDSLFQATLQRISGLTESTLKPLVVCNEEYRFVIAEQMRCMGQSGTLVLEPVGTRRLEAVDSVIWRPVLRVRRRRRPRIGQRLAGSSGKVVIV